jgi:hypothetical protein
MKPAVLIPRIGAASPRLKARITGFLYMLTCLGWLTFLSGSLARDLYPYNLAPGLFGEATLTVSLLVLGVERAAMEGASSSRGGWAIAAGRGGGARVNKSKGERRCRRY